MCTGDLFLSPHVPYSTRVLKLGVFSRAVATLRTDPPPHSQSWTPPSAAQPRRASPEPASTPSLIAASLEGDLFCFFNLSEFRFEFRFKFKLFRFEFTFEFDLEFRFAFMLFRFKL
jgi:hypothetical protein